MTAWLRLLWLACAAILLVIAITHSHWGEATVWAILALGLSVEAGIERIVSRLDLIHQALLKR